MLPIYGSLIMKHQAGFYLQSVLTLMHYRMSYVMFILSARADPREEINYLPKWAYHSSTSIYYVFLKLDRSKHTQTMSVSAILSYKIILDIRIYTYLAPCVDIQFSFKCCILLQLSKSYFYFVKGHVYHNQYLVLCDGQ